MYETLKALHIIFVVTWFAGLFYVVRLFVYHAEALESDSTDKKVLIDQFTLMQNRLWYGITVPSSLFTLFLGGSLLKNWMPISEHPWLQMKLFFLLGLFSYHLVCGVFRKRLQSAKNYPSSFFLRIYNELATLFLVMIVFLVVLKDGLGALQGTGVFIAVSVLLFAGIFAYRRFRRS